MTLHARHLWADGDGVGDHNDSETLSSFVDPSIPVVARPQHPHDEPPAAEASSPNSRSGATVTALIARDTPADEALLLQLVAEELNTREKLRSLEHRLLRRAHERIDNPKEAIALARVVRCLEASSTAVAKRIGDALLATSTLRARRRFLVGYPHDADV